MVHREFARKHVPREAYLVSRRHRSDALILSCASHFTNDASGTRAANLRWSRRAHESSRSRGPYVFLEEVEHSLVDKPVTCDQFSPINRV